MINERHYILYNLTAPTTAPRAALAALLPSRDIDA
jgi:hypothetical protein